MATTPFTGHCRTSVPGHSNGRSLVPFLVPLVFILSLISVFDPTPCLASMKVTVHGDILLGGIFPIHQKGKGGKTRCGLLNKDRGVQRLEAMLFAIDKINNDTTLLPNVKLGAIILDTCSSDSYALNQSLEFIRASINTVESSAFQCHDGSSPKPRFEGLKVIRGVVGGSYSEVSLQVANLLRLFRIPQVSYASTGTSLSDKSRYDFFARTVPPDTFQALALVDVVQRFNWSYVSIVSSEGQYGDSGMKAFISEARNRNICIAVNEKVPHSATTEQFRDIFDSLKTKSNARAVVLFVRMEDARGILKAAQNAASANFFTWIASDGWGKEAKLVEGVEEVAEGAITVELQSKAIPEFDEYMKSLTPESNVRNPWFNEYWEQLFSCKLTTSSMSSEIGQWLPSESDQSGLNSSMSTCDTRSQQINESIGYRQETKVQFVVDAVYAFAQALHAAWGDLCRGKNRVCKELKELDGGHFYKQYLLKVNFSDIVLSQVRFDESGDGLGRYNLYNYQKVNSKYSYVKIGNWTGDGLDIDTNKLLWNERSRSVPESVCSHPCQTGEIKIMQQGDRCCWICNPCRDQEYVVDEFTCKKCPDGWWPHPGNKSSCFQLPEQYMKWDSVFALVPIGVALLGIILTVFVAVTFLRFKETPIVKASGRELSFILLGGILSSFLMTFALLAKPSLFICSIQRFGVGFSFSIIYGALLTKTNRISRIFDSARKSARRPSFISPKSQVIITIIIVLIQVIGTVIWFVLEPPGTRHFFPDDSRKSQVILKCRVKDSSFLLSLIYNMFLITTCTVYAVKTRKIPENFNESKFIGFTMYTTCIIWLAFVPLFFGTGNNFEVQITTLSVSISLSAYVALFCLFSPKIYIIIFHPDKNVRKLTMNSTTYKRALTSSTAIPPSNHDQVKMSVIAPEAGTSGLGKSRASVDGSSVESRVVVHAAAVQPPLPSSSGSILKAEDRPAQVSRSQSDSDQFVSTDRISATQRKVQVNVIERTEVTSPSALPCTSQSETQQKDLPDQPRKLKLQVSTQGSVQYYPPSAPNSDNSSEGENTEQGIQDTGQEKKQGVTITRQTIFHEETYI